MNSFTKAPPKTIKKFRFETDFNLEEERLRIELLQEEEMQALEEEAAQEAVMAEPPAPSFSEEEVRYMRDESFKEGYNKGAEDVRQSLENDVAVLCRAIETQLTIIAEQEAKQVQDTQKLLAQITVAAIKKIGPHLVEQVGQDIITEMIYKALEDHPDEARLTIYVHETLVDPVTGLLPRIQSQKGFSGKLLIAAAADLLPGDCKIEWADGGMERLSRNLSTRIEDVIAHIIDLLPKTDSNADTERTSQ